MSLQCTKREGEVNEWNIGGSHLGLWIGKFHYEGVLSFANVVPGGSPHRL